MPILNNFTVPSAAKLLEFPENAKSELFITFISSIDPTTKQSWCPDVRAALPNINAAFSADDAPVVAMVEVGHRPEYVTLHFLLSTGLRHVNEYKKKQKSSC